MELKSQRDAADPIPHVGVVFHTAAQRGSYNYVYHAGGGASPNSEPSVRGIGGEGERAAETPAPLEASSEKRTCRRGRRASPALRGTKLLYNRNIGPFLHNTKIKKYYICH